MVCPIIGPRILRWEERQVNEERQVELNVGGSWRKIPITLIDRGSECKRLVTSIIGKQLKGDEGLSPTLLQLRVLRLGFFQDGDVGVGVFPERQEILICSLGFGGVACERVGTC